MTTVTLPKIQTGRSSSNGRPALLLRIGPGHRWPVMIGPDDFNLVQEKTGFSLWGVQGCNVVVGDENALAGRPAVARLLLGFRPTEYGLVPAFRDGSPLNMMRDNLGIRSIVSGKTYWLELRPGETDPTHDTRGYPCRVPAALLRHRELMPEPQPKIVRPNKPWYLSLDQPQFMAA